MPEVDACEYITCRYKTVMTQYHRKGAIGALLVTPIIFIVLILLGQGISELLDGPRIPSTVRENLYCGWLLCPPSHHPICCALLD